MFPCGGGASLLARQLLQANPATATHPLVYVGCLSVHAIGYMKPCSTQGSSRPWLPCPCCMRAVHAFTEQAWGCAAPRCRALYVPHACRPLSPQKSPPTHPSRAAYRGPTGWWLQSSWQWPGPRPSSRPPQGFRPRGSATAHTHQESIASQTRKASSQACKHIFIIIIYYLHAYRQAEGPPGGSLSAVGKRGQTCMEADAGLKGEGERYEIEASNYIGWRGKVHVAQQQPPPLYPHRIQMIELAIPQWEHPLPLSRLHPPHRCNSTSAQCLSTHMPRLHGLPGPPPKTKPSMQTTFSLPTVHVTTSLQFGIQTTFKCAVKRVNEAAQLGRNHLGKHGAGACGSSPADERAPCEKSTAVQGNIGRGGPLWKEL
jgi:hypothetical protein